MKLAPLGLVALAVVLFETAAFAQDAPPPDGAEPPGAVSRLRWSAGLFIGLPQGDLDDFADPSIGLRADVGFNINPQLSVHGSLRYILVNVDGDIEDFVDSVTYYDFGAGVRYAFGAQGKVTPFVDGELVYSTTSAEGDGLDDSQSDPGLVVRGGGTYAWRPNMDIIFFGSYTHLFLDEDEWGPDASGAWIELGGGVQGYF